jgi:hypothetical protein
MEIVLERSLLEAGFRTLISGLGLLDMMEVLM